MEYFCEINENLTDKKLSGMDPNLVKRVVLKHVVDNGYIKGSYGYHNNNGTSYRGSPTVAEIVSILDQEVDESRLADEKFSQEMESWINSLQPAGNFAEYQQRIKDTWGKNYFVRSDLGMLCSAVNSFLKDKEYKQRQQDKADRQQAHQEKVASDSNR
jgi:hypothetical protein